jgi:hypothetical protein
VNAARLTRSLEQSGFNHEQAVGLSESLADEIERTVATKEHVELVVTREVGSLRHDLQSQIGELRAEMIGTVGDLKTSMIEWTVGLVFGQFGMFLLIGGLLRGK